MTIDVDLASVRARLSRRVPVRYVGEAQRHAAVAAVLRPARAAHDSELLLIRRAEREGDPWSGHIALPGGHSDPTDRDLLATARRETLEELGLDLSKHEFLGALDEHAASARGQFIGLVVSPFVFALRGDAPLRPNGEVADVLWSSLGQMARGETAVEKELERNGQRVRFPGFGVGEHVVWGLTHRVLQSLFAVLSG